MKKDNRLNDCPLCGSENVGIHQQSDEYGYKLKYYFSIWCDDCELTINSPSIDYRVWSDDISEEEQRKLIERYNNLPHNKIKIKELLEYINQELEIAQDLKDKNPEFLIDGYWRDSIADPVFKKITDKLKEIL